MKFLREFFKNVAFVLGLVKSPKLDLEFVEFGERTYEGLGDLTEEEKTNLNIFMTIVESMNDGLEDNRMSSKEGVLNVLKELHEYNALKGEFMIVSCNLMTDSSGEAKVFYEV